MYVRLISTFLSIYSSNIGVPEKTTEGILFCPVEYTISNSGAEKVGSRCYLNIYIYYMCIHSYAYWVIIFTFHLVDWLKRTRISTEKNISLPSDLENILQ